MKRISQKTNKFRKHEDAGFKSDMQNKNYSLLQSKNGSQPFRREAASVISENLYLFELETKENCSDWALYYG